MGEIDLTADLQGRYGFPFLVEKNRELEVERDRLAAELAQEQERNAALNATNHDLLDRIVAVQDVEQRIAGLETNRDILQAALAQERAKSEILGRACDERRQGSIEVRMANTQLQAKVVRLREALEDYYARCQQSHQHERERIDPTGLACPCCRRARAALSEPDEAAAAMGAVVRAAVEWVDARAAADDWLDSDADADGTSALKRWRASITALIDAVDAYRKARGSGGEHHG